MAADENFILSILQRGDEAKTKVAHQFTGLSFFQLNWKPHAGKWSIAQCLEHLIIADSCYFKDLEQITSGKYRMSFWEKHSPLTRIWGSLMKDQLQENVKRKMKAPGVIRPSASELSADIIERYHKNLETFLQYISNCRRVDLDNTIINSPTIHLVTYSLRDAFYFLINHEHRHINQAFRVKMDNAFPDK